MRIGGLTPFTLSDFPGRTAAIVFTQGCNYRCPFCHNESLLPLGVPADQLVPERHVWELLESRRERLDGLVITGGEPTLQPDLPDFIRRARRLGYEIKLDTNGSRPHVLQVLLSAGLLDYVAMDVKAPWRLYNELAGVTTMASHMRTSMEAIASSGVEHEFRTTVVPQLLSETDVMEIRGMIPDGSFHRLQTFIPDFALDPSLRHVEAEVA